MRESFIPSTPYARLIAGERGVPLSDAVPTGRFGAVRARDIPEAPAGTGDRATPLARRMAQALGVELSAVRGSGHREKILKRDVLAAQAAPAPAAGVPASQAPAGGERRERLAGMRGVVARRMSRAHAEIPPVTHTVKADVTELEAARRRLGENGARYSVNDFVLMAVAKALDTHREMLVSIDGEEVIYKDRINLGMAVALDAGLIVPVLRDADRLTLPELSAAARDLAVRTREGKLLPDEYKGNTFTVTNLGMFGVESFTPIINQPDAAILGVCCIEDVLCLAEGTVCVRRMMRTSVTYDHRLLDGATVARFQKEVKRLLENPIEIVL